MTWLLLLVGIALMLLGIWGGPGRARKRKELEALARKQHTVSEAWDILTKPLEDPAIKIPEHRPWYLPGGDRRFQQGLLVGLGTGLVIAAMVATSMPAKPPATAKTPEPPKTNGQTAGQPAGQTPTAKPPAQQTPPAQQPAAQQPAAQPPKPANVTFVVDPGDAASTIGDKLKAQGLIADPDQFVTRVTELGADTRLKAGTFVIPTGATLDQVIAALTS